MSSNELYRDKKKKRVVKVETHCLPCSSHEELGCGRKLGNVGHCFTMVGLEPNGWLQKDENESPEYFDLKYYWQHYVETFYFSL